MAFQTGIGRGLFSSVPHGSMVGDRIKWPGPGTGEGISRLAGIGYATAVEAEQLASICKHLRMKRSS